MKSLYAFWSYCVNTIWTNRQKDGKTNGWTEGQMNRWMTHGQTTWKHNASSPLKWAKTEKRYGVFLPSLCVLFYVKLFGKIESLPNSVHVSCDVNFLEWLKSQWGTIKECSVQLWQSQNTSLWSWWECRETHSYWLTEVIKAYLKIRLSY